ncbi:pseudouridine synthase [Pirellulaceae bacterium SH449]
MTETDDFIVDDLTRPIAILYRDDYFVAVFKPAGLIIHRSKLTLPHEPVLMQAVRDQIGQFVYPMHRLDRPTAGIVLFGLNSEAAGKLGQLFIDRKIDKYYQALVRGHTEESFMIDRPLRERFGEDWEKGSTDDNPEQSAVTHFRRIEEFEAPWPIGDFASSRYTLLEIKPVTGRWHQIRRHLNHIAKPVIGDHRHGDHRHNQMMYEKTGVYRMLLSAVRLDFRHPYTHELTTITAGRGSEFDRVIETLKSCAVSS